MHSLSFSASVLTTLLTFSPLAQAHPMALAGTVCVEQSTATVEEAVRLATDGATSAFEYQCDRERDFKARGGHTVFRELKVKSVVVGHGCAFGLAYSYEILAECVVK